MPHHRLVPEWSEATGKKVKRENYSVRYEKWTTKGGPVFTISMWQSQEAFVRWSWHAVRFRQTPTVSFGDASEVSLHSAWIFGRVRQVVNMAVCKKSSGVFRSMGER